MEAVVKKNFCVVLIAFWLNVIGGKAIGHVVPQHSQALLKTDGNIADVFRDAGNGSSWYQMLLVFARGSSNSQSQPHTEDAPCNGSSAVPANRREESSMCKDGFIELESRKCYLFSIIKRTWHDALAVCEGLGSTLAYPVNVLENTVLVNYIFTQFNGKQAWWMGGTDEGKLGEWVWAHNKTHIIYSDWDQGYPNKPSPQARCMIYGHYGEMWKWLNAECKTQRSFVCQQ